MTEAAPQTQAAAENRVIGRSWGISITLVVTIITGIVANLSMMASLNERVSGFDIQLRNQGDSLRDIRSAVTELSASTRTEVRDLRNQNMDLRERLTKLEARLEIESRK